MIILDHRNWRHDWRHHPHHPHEQLNLQITIHRKSRLAEFRFSSSQYVGCSSYAISYIMMIIPIIMIDVIIIQLPKCVSLMQLICLSANSLIILAQLATTILSMYLYMYLNLYLYLYLYLICICIWFAWVPTASSSWHTWLPQYCHVFVFVFVFVIVFVPNIYCSSTMCHVK